MPTITLVDDDRNILASISIALEAEGYRIQTRINRRDAGLLQAKGSLYVTRPTLIHYSATREDYVGLANELFDVVKSGKMKIPVNQTYPLEKAHRDLESRGTTGSSILTP